MCLFTVAYCPDLIDSNVFFVFRKFILITILSRQCAQKGQILLYTGPIMLSPSGCVLMLTILLISESVYSDCHKRNIYDLQDIPSETRDWVKEWVGKIKCGQAGEDVPDTFESCSEETTRTEEYRIVGASNQCDVKCNCNELDMKEESGCICVPIMAWICGVNTVIGFVETRSRTPDVFNPSEESYKTE